VTDIPSEITITLTKQAGQRPAVTIGGEEAADVMKLSLWADGPNGITFDLERVKFADYAEWHAVHEYAVTEITLTAKVVRRD